MWLGHVAVQDCHRIFRFRRPANLDIDRPLRLFAAITAWLFPMIICLSFVPPSVRKPSAGLAD